LLETEMKMKLYAIVALALSSLLASSTAHAFVPPVTTVATLSCSSGFGSGSVALYGFELQVTSPTSGTLKILLPVSSAEEAYRGLGIPQAIPTCTVSPTASAVAGTNYILGNLTVTGVGIGANSAESAQGYGVVTFSFTSIAEHSAT